MLLLSSNSTEYFKRIEYCISSSVFFFSVYMLIVYHFLTFYKLVMMWNGWYT
uniref:Uncharacterized protein n=1 Tax=Anguilla anguilla TaxID=7936 RepID=A0A0E9SJQ1_ANGAN